MFAHWNKTMLNPVAWGGEVTKVLSGFLASESVRARE